MVPDTGVPRADIVDGADGTHMPQIDVYPAFDALYYSYFLAGLYSLYGSNRVRFTAAGFPRFTHRCLAFRISTPAGERKIFIHGSDEPALPEEGTEWCDTLGKVNLDPSLVPEQLKDRVVCLGPIFPFRVWTGGVAMAIASSNLARSNSRLRSYASDVPASYPARGTMAASALLHLKQYVKIGFQRLPLKSYSPGSSRNDYVFFSSAVWPELDPVPEYAQANRYANSARLEFLKACKAVPRLKVEGGIFMRPGYVVPGYEGFTKSKTDGHRSYIEKTKLSSVVLNAPSVKWCHSWKLGEYLALGKAIISLPIVRDLPAPLVHGVHVHYVDGSFDAMRDAIALISSDDMYRAKLERNARDYHERHLQPTAMMSRLLAADKQRRQPVSRLLNGPGTGERPAREADYAR